MSWTEIILGLLTLLGGCAWFVNFRKDKQEAGGIRADNRQKDMNRRTKQEQSQARLGYALQGGGKAKRNLRRVETVTVTRIDTVYIQKDSLSVENKKIGLSASADGGSKKSGLSELFLCHD